ncbi:MAG TPA: hypothetical protein VHY37_10695 [Tepidisphaeraceae bacterium]|jgi:hypothetical protein|nr:hypothetical protein [Tepidisphaeraceae bacterium]
MNHSSVGYRLLMFLATCGAAAGAMYSLSGCAALGVAAQALPPAQIIPQYKGLQGQSVAIMVWADRDVRDSWPDLPLDTNAGLEHKLKAGQKDLPKYLKDTTFPISALSMVRAQEDHPEWDGVPITDIAGQFHVTRLIYVEVDEFQTRASDSTDLYKGSIVGSVKVIEIKDGKTKVAYTEDNIQAVYPKGSLEEGVLDAGDDKIYTGTLDAFTTQLVQRFLPHDEQKD